MKRYAEALALEVKRTGEKRSDYLIDTIFFGGGTPSMFSEKELEIIIDYLYKYYHISDDIEFTIESNPKTLNKEKLLSYLKLGINRLSIGVQSLDDQLLKILGRVHTTHDFYKNYEEAREAGFNNINTDIMFSIPKQTMRQWLTTIEKITMLRPEHISFYGLKIEENTPFHKMMKRGELFEKTDEEDRNMYKNILNKLRTSGYIQYEISNAAQKNFECRHNIKYWKMEEYLGLGLGAHSYIQGRRYSNEQDLNKYIQNVNNNIDPCVWTHTNTKNDEISEYMFTGLRLTKGIKLTDFSNRFGISIDTIFKEEMEEMQKGGWLNISNGRMCLTPKGIDVSNRIMAQFII